MIFMLLVGCLTVALGLGLFGLLTAERGDGVATGPPLLVSGVVVRNKLSFGSGSGSVFVRPVIRFTTLDGQLVEEMATTGWAMALPRYKMGEVVQVLYAASNPRRFRLVTEWDAHSI